MLGGHGYQGLTSGSLKLGNKPKSNLVVDAFNQAVTELVEGYVSSNTDSADTDEKQSDSDSPKESGDTE